MSGRCGITIAALALGCTAPVSADPVSRWQAYIDEAAIRFGLPAEWITRVMRAESGGQTRLAGRPITSPAGAMGLMQLMPATWREMRARLRLGPNPHTPRDNILAGSFYLRLMYERFGYPGMFAAYNVGPGRYAEHLLRGRALPGETRAYLAAVGADADGVAPPASPRGDTIFFAIRGPAQRSAQPTVGGLFVTLDVSAR
ncbi:lytic transglycosylase [Rhizorhabdus dicambivorans]|uniref:Lytic transglycosylase n=2 Tax=Rhizorhabdus dicambivorans TaxID=1850238 RepID=A0A2A4FP62_9SPHN|nr:lytic transglycosylase domain-containing protein [Rhizorhabdus dicambivorans]ATE67312.1 lytic transglycosylase [Rhizorhabdus dicambivorans]PCE39889.1 lytic transglycosylase [Rhizorhabdus dicambivorans]